LPVFSFFIFIFILRFNRLYIKTKATETLNASLKPGEGITPLGKGTGG